MLKLLSADIQNKIYDFVDVKNDNLLNKYIDEYFFELNYEKLNKTISKNINSRVSINSLVRDYNMVVNWLWVYDLEYINFKCIKIYFSFQVIHRQNRQEFSGDGMFKIDVKTTTELEMDGLGEFFNWSNYGISIFDIDYNFYLFICNWILDIFGDDDNDF